MIQEEALKKEFTSNLVSSPLCWQLACDKKKQAKREAKCLRLQFT